VNIFTQIGDHQQNWWYEEGPSKGPGWWALIYAKNF